MLSVCSVSTHVCVYMHVRVHVYVSEGFVVHVDVIHIHMHCDWRRTTYIHTYTLPNICTRKLTYIYAACMHRAAEVSHMEDREEWHAQQVRARIHKHTHSYTCSHVQHSMCINGRYLF